MKKLLTGLLALLLMGSLSAQTLVRDPAGFQFEVPPNFQVKQEPAGTTCTDGKNILVVKSHTFSSFQAFAADANLARDGFELVGDVRDLPNNGRHFRASRANPQGGYLIADTFVRFSPYGGGSLVVMLSDSQHAEQAYYTGQAISDKLQFTQPAAANIWEQALAGKHLLYLYTGNGYSERFDLYLFADRSFSTRSDISSLSVNGSGAAAGGGEGRWSITPSGQLLLAFHNGNRQVYQLTPRQASNEVGLNGKRFFVTSL